MTEDELEEFLWRRNWTISRSRTGKQNAFAAKSGPRKARIARYIGTAAKLRDMSTKEVLSKLKERHD